MFLIIRDPVINIIFLILGFMVWADNVSDVGQCNIR